MNWARMPAGKPARRKPGASARSVVYARNPLLASKTPPWRSKALVAMIALGSCLLVGRAAYVQIIGTDFYVKQGEKRYAHTLKTSASRGRIFDRNGQLLASSVVAPSVFAIPKEFAADPQQRRQLARLLGMTAADLDKRLSSNPNWVWLRRQVDDATWQQVKTLGIAGVHHAPEYKRRYPEGETAAHVVGFTDVVQRGQEGVELAFQASLQGRDGTREVMKDRFGRVIDDYGDQIEPVNGTDMALAIDAKVQSYAYQRVRDAVLEHKAQAGSVVVLDVRTGEVLALANYPSFDPNDRRSLSGEQLRNRALTDTFEPGSTMKPFIAALAMDSGRVTPQTVIQTAPGWFGMSGGVIRDAHPHGPLTVSEVVQKSSNVGTVRMAMAMQPREMWELYSEVGLGSKPRIDFPGAVSGRLRPYKSWLPIEQATMSYGYGLSASLFQLAQAYTVFASDGRLLPMSLLKQTVPPVGPRVLTPETAQEVRKMLQMAAGPGGTAPKAQAVGYSVGGKTGTAHKHKEKGKGYETDKYRAWFVGLAPISQPRVVVAVMVDEPGNGKRYGGDVAAPVFSQVVQHTLRMLDVKPDLDFKPLIVTQDLPAVEESF